MPTMKRGAAAATTCTFLRCAILLLNIAGSAAQYVPADHGPTFGFTAMCDGRLIPGGSPLWGHLGSLLRELTDNTPYMPYYDFKTRAGGRDAPVYGEAWCQPSSVPEVCEACLHQLSFDIWRICNNAIGARVEYPDCSIHYKGSPF